MGWRLSGLLVIQVLGTFRGISPAPNTFLEGDILTRQTTGSVGQSAPLADPDRLWPLGRLHFLLDPATLDPISATNRKIRQLVSQAMDYIHSKAQCIVFIDVTTLNKTVTDFVKIIRSGAGKPCYSELGRVGGEQELGLNLACFPVEQGRHLIYIAVHELMHALGFAHEQNRPDRDDHIEVNEENIAAGMEGNYEKRAWANRQFFSSQYDSANALDQQLTPYDRNSVLHYNPTDGAKDDSKPVFSFKYEEEEDDNGMSWPMADTSDPLTTIDQVELMLAYHKEASCSIGEAVLVDYVHMNRLSTGLVVEAHNLTNFQQQEKLVNLEEKNRVLEGKVATLELIVLSLKKNMNSFLDLHKTVNMLHPQDPQCLQPFTTLTDTWRKIQYGKYFQSSKGGPGHHCDKSRFSAGWYSLRPGGEHSVGLPTAPPPVKYRGNSEWMRTCGTYVIPWASRAPPALGQPPVTVRIKWAYESEESHSAGSWEYDSKVVTCYQNILYYLKPVKGCFAAYCAL